MPSPYKTRNTSPSAPAQLQELRPQHPTQQQPKEPQAEKEQSEEQQQQQQQPKSKRQQLKEHQPKQQPTQEQHKEQHSKEQHSKEEQAKGQQYKERQHKEQDSKGQRSKEHQATQQQPKEQQSEAPQPKQGIAQPPKTSELSKSQAIVQDREAAAKQPQRSNASAHGAAQAQAADEPLLNPMLPQAPAHYLFGQQLNPHAPMSANPFSLRPPASHQPPQNVQRPEGLNTPPQTAEETAEIYAAAHILSSHMMRGSAASQTMAPDLPGQGISQSLHASFGPLDPGKLAQSFQPMMDFPEAERRLETVLQAHRAFAAAPRATQLGIVQDVFRETTQITVGGPRAEQEVDMALVHQALFGRLTRLQKMQYLDHLWESHRLLDAVFHVGRADPRSRAMMQAYTLPLVSTFADQVRAGLFNPAGIVNWFCIVYHRGQEARLRCALAAAESPEGASPEQREFIRQAAISEQVLTARKSLQQLEAYQLQQQQQQREQHLLTAQQITYHQGPQASSSSSTAAGPYYPPAPPPSPVNAREPTVIDLTGPENDDEPHQPAGDPPRRLPTMPHEAVQPGTKRKRGGPNNHNHYDDIDAEQRAHSTPPPYSKRPRAPGRGRHHEAAWRPYEGVLPRPADGVRALDLGWSLFGDPAFVRATLSAMGPEQLREGIEVGGLNGHFWKWALDRLAEQGEDGVQLRVRKA
ncbi:hypothetical protein F4778DRAFT_779271 [Xylariomycetidae sp. FL2044]|nr:hypothetical protein F4778DRAFT_779271 [Xylariomycetidae sp. FL2044]